MRLLRVATYNVHGNKGTDGRIIADRPLGIIRHLDADCVALQEFVNAPTVTGEPLLAHWSRSLGMEGVCAPAFERGGEVFGNAILTRFEILERRDHEISVRGYRRRVLLEALLRADDLTLQVMSIHLGVSPRERAQQAERLFGLCCTTRADVHLLLGDFNEWSAFSSVSRRLRAHFGASRRIATFPSPTPVVGPDRIWVHPRDCLLETHVDASRPARVASDHLPLVATVDCGGVARAGVAKRVGSGLVGVPMLASERTRE
jgi:endonuclease/exonuclease/phosphatase family metal-dependent hydrolase